MHNQHVYNLVAKTIRENFPTDTADKTGVEGVILLAGRAMLYDIALAFAERFREEEDFDALTFLHRCSPDNDLYPITELWEES